MSQEFILSNIRDSLLPKLMSGKIRVNLHEEASANEPGINEDSVELEALGYLQRNGL